MIYIQSFIKIGSAIQKLMGGGGEYTQHGDRIRLSFFKSGKYAKNNINSTRGTYQIYL
jgi:hypothetical protein